MHASPPMANTAQHQRLSHFHVSRRWGKLNNKVLKRFTGLQSKCPRRPCRDHKISSMQPVCNQFQACNPENAFAPPVASHTALSVAHAAQRQHVSLTAALLEDDRLAALPVRLVLQEFVSEGLIHHSDSGSNLGDHKPVRNGSAGSGPNCTPGSGGDSASGTSHDRAPLLPAAAAPAALPMLSGHRMSVDVMKKLRWGSRASWSV